MDFVVAVQDEFHGSDLVADEKHRSHIAKNIARNVAIYITDQVAARIIGAMTDSPNSSQIGWLAVHPGMRRKGVGSSLVEYMLTRFLKTIPIKVKTFLITDKPGAVANKFYKT